MVFQAANFRGELRQVRLLQKSSLVFLQTTPSLDTSTVELQMANIAAKLFALNPKLTVADLVKIIHNGADMCESDNRLKHSVPKRLVELLTTRASR
jgi:hypothetical protein